MTSEEIFCESVSDAFKYLSTDYGFVGPVFSGPDKWGIIRQQYSHEEWFITPFYDTHERCVNVDFGDANHTFTLHMYMAVVSPPCYYKLGHAFAHNDKDIDPLVRLYAECLKRRCTSLLARDRRVLEQMIDVKQFRQALCPPYSEQLKHVGAIVSPYA